MLEKKNNIEEEKYRKKVVLLLLIIHHLCVCAIPDAMWIQLKMRKSKDTRLL